MTSEPMKWQSYEEVATYLLDQFATEFGLERVEGKQKLRGCRSGTIWEIDAKGVQANGAGFLLVECRRYTESRVKQDEVGGLAYRICDMGLSGGIVVSPLGLQAGAEMVARAENVISVRLDENSTKHEYVLRFLDKVMIGLKDNFRLSDHDPIVEKWDEEGNLL